MLETLRQLDPRLQALLAGLFTWGVTVLGASEKAPDPIDRVDMRRPLTLVVGSEGTGIRPELLALCDELVTIPQSGQVGSLNAAVSAGILLYEVHRQRRISPGK